MTDSYIEADLRAFLNTLHGRGGGPPSPHWKSAVWYGIKSLFGYLADEEDCKDITQKITVSRRRAPAGLRTLTLTRSTSCWQPARTRASWRSSRYSWTPG